MDTDIEAILSGLVAERATVHYEHKLTKQKALSKELLLIDYLPIMRIIDNTLHYGYLGFFDNNKSATHAPCPIIIFKPSPRSNDRKIYDMETAARINTDSEEHAYIKKFTQPLEQFLKTRKSSRLLRTFALHHTVEFSEPEESHKEVKLMYAGEVAEVAGILILTDELQKLRQIASEPNTAGGGTISGLEFPEQVTSSLFRMNMRFRDWITACYKNYMLQVNLELGEYYTKFYSPMGFQIGKTDFFSVFHEFVPFACKFDKIPNPLLDGTTSTTIAEHIRKQTLLGKAITQFPILSHLEPDELSNSVQKMRLAETPSEYDRYMFRATRSFYLLASKAAFPVDPRTGTVPDKFSFALCNGEIYDTILTLTSPGIFCWLHEPKYMQLNVRNGNVYFQAFFDNDPKLGTAVYRIETWQYLLIRYFLNFKKSVSTNTFSALLANNLGVEARSLQEIKEDAV